MINRYIKKLVSVPCPFCSESRYTKDWLAVKPVIFIFSAIVVLPVIYLGLKHESIATRVDLRSASTDVRVSIVNVSYWDRWTANQNPSEDSDSANASQLGPDGNQPETRIGTMTVNAWGRVYTLPPEMVRDCFGPRQTAGGWVMRTSNEGGIYLGTMVGSGLGKTLVWWNVAPDHTVRRWVYPMRKHQDLSSLPKPTDQPVETKKLMSFDE